MAIAENEQDEVRTRVTRGSLDGLFGEFSSKFDEFDLAQFDDPTSITQSILIYQANKLIRVAYITKKNGMLVKLGDRVGLDMLREGWEPTKAELVIVDRHSGEVS